MTLADRNYQIYADPSMQAKHAGGSGWSEHGERAALLTAAPQVRAKSTLDIGVGRGRTVDLLALLTDDYIGIDYVADRVKTCQARYPDIDLRLGDARHLDFTDSTFYFTVFSFNGIDTQDEADRRQALIEMRRVTRPGGIVYFSTLNRNGCSYAERPWETHRPGCSSDLSARNIAKTAWTTANDPGRLPRRLRNWLAIRRYAVDHGSWALSPLAALDYTLVGHFVTIGGLRAELADVGLDPIAIYGTDGSTVPPSSETSIVDSFHVVARAM